MNWLVPTPPDLDAGATGALATALAAMPALGGALGTAIAAWFAARGAQAASASARAARDTVEEMRDQRKAAARPALAVETLRHSPFLKWRNRQDITSWPEPMQIKVVNLGGGPALDLRIRYELSAERANLERACEYWEFLLRDEPVEVRYLAGYWSVLRSDAPGSMTYTAGRAALSTTVQLAHIPPGGELLQELPPAIRGALFLLAIDSASGSAFAPQPDAPPLSESEDWLEDALLSLPRSGAPITLKVAIEYSSVYEPLVFGALIDIDASLSIPFQGLDHDGWKLRPESVLTSPSTTVERGRIEASLHWAVRREGAPRPTEAARVGVVFGSRLTRPIALSAPAQPPPAAAGDAS